MGYTQVALEDKILEMYPEIYRNQIHTSIYFDEEKDAFVFGMEKEGHRRYAFIDKKDADACMDSYECLYLGVLIDQYIKDLEREVGIET